MHPSSTYNAVLEEGAINYGKRILLMLGEILFGPASEVTKATIQAIEELPQLELWLERLMVVKSWEELLN